MDMAGRSPKVNPSAVDAACSLFSLRVTAIHVERLPPRSGDHNSHCPAPDNETREQPSWFTCFSDTARGGKIPRAFGKRADRDGMGWNVGIRRAGESGGCCT
ncbi:hypothetical protein GCM10017566_61750 [Amycolatopsis bartoniae]|uniref:Uncharacterized protein n=1 Tax=Amycolatopsis bartoniae TaxID=941986 RepID=A0A8H9J2R0_9PSEU|nr:hypothetical protein GCM10017566_61750 [Amycolatopsis bartoniae]